MRKFFGIVLAVIVVSSFNICSFAKDLKIGYVNTIEVFNEYEKTKQQDEQLKAEKEEIKKNLEAKEEKIQEMQNRLDVLKDEQKAKERDKLDRQIKEYRQIRQKKLTDIKKERDKMMNDIIKDINETIKDYGKKNGYDLVLNGNSVLYGVKSKDLTSVILKIINKKN